MPSHTTAVIAIEIQPQMAALNRTLSAPLLATGAESDLNTILAVLLKFDKEFDVAESDPLLSPAGRVDAAQRVARAAIAALDAIFGAKVGVLDTRIASVERSIQPTTKPSTDVATRLVTELRAQEILAGFRGLDPLERTLIYIGIEDVEVREALETAPPVLFRARPGDMPTLQPFVDPEPRREQILARAEAQAPEQARELRDFQRLRSLYASTIETARRAVLEAVPSLRQSEPVVS
jgi:hypothetical protein